MTRVLIGNNGTIGKSLLDQCSFDYVFNSHNIQDLAGGTYSLVICAAPSGNRLAINRGENNDLDNVKQIIQTLDTCKIDQLVLISSIDVVTDPNSVYGANRLYLESYVQQHKNYYILRLCTLVGQHIKKNMLFDLINQQYVDKINGQDQLQWCILDNIIDQLNWAETNNNRITNIVSEPITNKKIVEQFFNSVKLTEFDTHKTYNLKPYVYTQQQIFDAIERYLK